MWSPDKGRHPSPPHEANHHVILLSLTHFCEVHGPTSILCSQVLPSSCARCNPDLLELSPNDTPPSSHHGTSPPLGAGGADRDETSGRQRVPRPERVSTSLGGCAASTSPKSPESPYASATASAQRIEDHPWFLNREHGRTDTEKLSRFRGAEGDTCASCSLTLPEDVSKQLPPGAPGTLKQDGKGRNGSPVLRSREVVYSCGGNHSDYDDDTRDSRLHHSSPASLHSSYSSDSSCHTHVVTYVSLRGPPNPADYALLRRASIRTLSCELLPRGLSSGPLSFGDAVAGYTIAYVFRLPDPTARGKRRSYALVALAGKDAGRAFRACPVIWRVFGRIAAGIVSAAERFQEVEKRREEGSTNGANSGYTPVASFLTGRAVDPEGLLRRAGHIRARNLAEIVGNEYIFAELHAQFVALLQQLGAMFGGFPVLEERCPSSPFGGADDAYPSRQRAPNVAKRVAKSVQSHRRARTEVDPSAVLLSPIPKPIPISQRRQAVA